MQLDKVSEKENKALERKELVFEIKESKVTPARKELKAKIAALSNSKEEEVVVDSVERHFGDAKVRVTARVYQNRETLEKTEPGYYKARTEGKKKKQEESKEPKKEASEAKEGEEKGKDAEKQGEGKKEGKEPEKKKGDKGEKGQEKKGKEEKEGEK